MVPWWKIRKLIKSLYNGANISEACKAADVCRMSFYRMTARSEKFAKMVEAAKRSRAYVYEDLLYKKAQDGNVTCIIVGSKAEMPNKYGDKPQVNEYHTHLNVTADNMQELARGYGNGALQKKRGEVTVE